MFNKKNCLGPLAVLLGIFYLSALAALVFSTMMTECIKETFYDNVTCQKIPFFAWMDEEQHDAYHGSKVVMYLGTIIWGVALTRELLSYCAWCCNCCCNENPFFEVDSWLYNSATELAVPGRLRRRTLSTQLEIQRYNATSEERACAYAMIGSILQSFRSGGKIWKLKAFVINTVTFYLPTIVRGIWMLTLAKQDWNALAVLLVAIALLTLEGLYHIWELQDSSCSCAGGTGSNGLAKNEDPGSSSTSGPEHSIPRYQSHVV